MCVNKITLALTSKYGSITVASFWLYQQLVWKCTLQYILLLAVRT